MLQTLVSRPPPLFLIIGNLAFPSSLTDPAFRKLSETPHFKATHFTSNTHWPTFAQLKATPQLQQLGCWFLMQLSNFLHSLTDAKEFQRPLTPFKMEHELQGAT